MRRNVIRISLLLGVLLSPLVVLVAQQTTALLVEGPSGQAQVIQVQGRRYVEVDELARITGGSLRFAGNQIILTLPASGNTSAQTVQSGSSAPGGYSREFVSAGIETMREILEWHAALKTAIERGYPLSDEWLGYFRRKIEPSLKHLETVASTDMDKKAAPLLAGEFHNMSALSEKYLKITASRDYFAPDSLNSDPLEERVLTCWRSLSSMASSNEFVDDGSCR
jgi:hypothetical protein